MCRLLFVQNHNRFKIGEHLKNFARIALESKEYQGDGWGCSYLINNEWQHYKNIKPVWEDDLNQFGETTRLIVHARSAFDDKIAVENNMPFYDDNYVFVFNGELQGVKIKSEGRIGAEKIFNFIKRFAELGMEAAMRKGLAIINKRTTYVRAMNIIIAEKDKVYYASDYNEDPAYFQMHYKEENKELIICSQPYPGESNWQKIKNKSIGVFT